MGAHQQQQNHKSRMRHLVVALVVATSIVPYCWKFLRRWQSNYCRCINIGAVAPHSAPLQAQRPQCVLWHACYGLDDDCIPVPERKENIYERWQNGTRSFHVSNEEMGFDPFPGERKILQVTYSNGTFYPFYQKEFMQSQKAFEGDTLFIDTPFEPFPWRCF